MIDEESDEMSPEEVASHFNEKSKKPKKVKPTNPENDIYALSARMKNAARFSAGGNLTAQGDMVVNTFTHVLKELYDFSETVQNKKTKAKLLEILKKHEDTPANLIGALMSGVKK